MNLEGVLEQASRQNTSCGQKVRLLRNNSNLFSQHAQQLSDLLNSVDPAINTLPCLSILVGFVNSKAFNTNGLKEVFLKGVEGFIERCVAWEIGYMSREFNEVCRGYKQKILDKPKKGVQTLLIAFQKLNQSQKAESTQRGLLLTLVHVDLFQLCLLSKCYNLALEAVTQDAIDMDPKRTGMTSTDFLLYCCYGGRICIGLRMYSRALELKQWMILKWIKGRLLLAIKILFIELDGWLNVLHFDKYMYLRQSVSTVFVQLFRLVDFLYVLQDLFLFTREVLQKYMIDDDGWMQQALV
eukprot:TRINITY_DN40586_c0_g4_i1.p1 TRINITY_DN40586_c0_g4~~TRINITY_DN40586_c0_g4_i1.p1  ORF type:complete len:297 (-),score=18.82 TRINITY_DN40586_c0_g4_i1:28-918(-)